MTNKNKNKNKKITTIKDIEKKYKDFKYRVVNKYGEDVKIVADVEVNINGLRVVRRFDDLREVLEILDKNTEKKK